MYIDLYFPLGLLVDRDEIQEALETSLSGVIAVVGAGSGTAGSNLDLEVLPGADRDNTLRMITDVLITLGVPGETVVALSDTGQRKTLVDLRSSNENLD